MILPITYYGNPILRKRAKPVKVFDKELKILCQNMIETMIHFDGVGIAAPQVGKSLQIFITDLTPDAEPENKQEPLIVINPKLTPISHNKENIGREGCLSIPRLYADVKRFYKVKLTAVDTDNNAFEMQATDFIARIFQHEYDHLQGILFTDQVLTYDKKNVEEFLQDLRKKNV